MNSNWKAGDKALCVDDSNQNQEIVGDFVSKGVTYLVAGFGAPDALHKTGLLLCGLTAYNSFPQFGFIPERFRKIIPACDRIAQQQDELLPHEGFWQGRADL